MEYKQKYYIDSYQVKALLGTGGQANVYLCENQHKFYAVKVYFPYNYNYEKYFEREVEILNKLKCQHLINIIQHKKNASVCLQNEDYSQAPVIVMQFAQRNRLTQYITIQGKLPAQICRALIKKLIMAIKHIHTMGITHRDIKTQNILFDSKYNLKIIDFGFSRNTSGQNGDNILYTKLGSQGYKPPQMLVGQYTGLAADLFAAGVILFFMYTGSQPFTSTKNTDSIYKFICQKKYDKFWSIHCNNKNQQFFPQSLKNLFQSFFSKSVDLRPNFQRLQKNQWLNGPTASEQQLIAEMESRYERIMQKDQSFGFIQNVIKNTLGNMLQ